MSPHIHVGPSLGARGRVDSRRTTGVLWCPLR
jgi:hypothetical protein